MDTDPRLAEITTRAHASDIPWLVAEPIEALAKLGIAERQNDDLVELLVERTRQLNGLLDSLSFDEKAIPR